MNHQNEAKRFQFNISTALLLMTVVITCFVWLQSRNKTESLRTQLNDIREIDRTLIISDSTQFAASRELIDWYGENRWRVFLPEGNEYSINFGSHETQLDSEGEALPKVERSFQMQPGEYEIKYQRTRVNSSFLNVFVDNELAISVQEQPEWKNKGSSQGGLFGISQQQSTAEPLELMRVQIRIHSSDFSKRLEAEGFTIWIEKSEEQCESASDILKSNPN